MYTRPQKRIASCDRYRQPDRFSRWRRAGCTRRDEHWRAGRRRLIEAPFFTSQRSGRTALQVEAFFNLFDYLCAKRFKSPGLRDVINFPTTRPKSFLSRPLISPAARYDINGCAGLRPCSYFVARRHPEASFNRHRWGGGFRVTNVCRRTNCCLGGPSWALVVAHQPCLR